jgi:hypothetical protein
MDTKDIPKEYISILNIIESGFEALIEVLELSEEQKKEFYELMDDKLFLKANRPDLVRK